ncbi:MAG TPA: outer membrane beta-barrel protein [Candidatus Edwardsbacteria bacterium]|nr:outer membrane beta-barrel protein [Candidatus Edwardsbacteria bacterium]
MKQLTITLLALALAGTAWGLSFNAGAAYFKPSGVEGGGSALFSLGAGKRVDDMVMVNVQLDFFNKTFKKEDVSTVDTSSTSIAHTTQRLVEYEHSVKYFPITAGAVITLPVGMLIHPYIEGRVGYGFAHVSYSYNTSLYNIPTTDRPESGTYSGFGWRLGGGARLGLGTRSALYGGIYYNGNTCSRSAGNDLFTDLNMSGLMIGAGLEISGF